ncbi:MAG: 50S ribosomal protein L18 [Dehalococcoidia bacterium]|nr:50S ribosomal protein L18 [Dehalococcoidia bacterium]
MAKTDSRKARLARHARLRESVHGTAERPRLCVFRSLDHIYAQVIDDERGHTLCSASTLEPEVAQKLAGDKKARAGMIGALLAQRSLEAGIKQVVFDRGGYKYHGRVKELAEAARKGGLSF